MAALAAASFAGCRNRILIASADAEFRERVRRSPANAEAVSEEAMGGAHALAKLAQFPCDSVLLDVHLPDLDAREVEAEIRREFPQVKVELVDSKLEMAVSYGRSTEERMLEGGGERGERVEVAREEREGWKSERSAKPVEALPGMIGPGRAMQQVYRLARMVAGRDTTVLVSGETGTGKELVAEAVHRLSRRSRNPLVVVNCAAIPEALLEAELFGHARGAFTGAVQSRLGRIHVAQGGTLFLDEIGELPLSMQAKLLRFLQNGEVQRLGSSDVYRVDVRVVCATNARLMDLVQAKQFRLDLYYRLSIFPIALPPLRERSEDIGELAEHFLEKLSAEAGLARKYLSGAAQSHLEQGDWGGNVRELQHALERAFILAGSEERLGVEHFQPWSGRGGE